MKAFRGLDSISVAGGLGALAFLGFLPTLFPGKYLIGVLTVAAIYGIWSVSWDFMSGLTGRENFGHSLFIGVGAYTAGFLNVPKIKGTHTAMKSGMIAAEVLLVSKKSQDDLHRWVYLDIGKFSGLAETMDEAIRYQFTTDRDHEEHGPCILAGPSCDSADVLYEKRPVQLPMGLTCGDKIIIRNCGAYTTTYSSVAFNGFPPLDVVVI